MTVRRRRGKAKAGRAPPQRRREHRSDDIASSESDEASSSSADDANSAEGESSESNSELDAIEQMLDDAEMERFWIPQDDSTEEPGKSQRFANCCCALLLVTFAVGTLFLRIIEEDYGVALGSRRSEEDHYGALGISRHASSTEVKRAYKALALKWHPDKNRGCEECEAKFQAVARAYETLGTPARRQTYDQVLGDAEPIPSAASTTLTDSTYREEILEQSDIWVIQVFDELEDACAHFAPHWERVAEELQPFAKFGRINARTDRQALRLLPISVRVYPTVVLVAHGFQPAICPLGSLNRAGKLKRWVLDNIPDSVTILGSPKEVRDFVTSGGSILKLLLLSDRSSASHKLRRAAINLEGQALLAQTKSELALAYEIAAKPPVAHSSRTSVRLLAFTDSQYAVRGWDLPKKDPSGLGLSKVLITAVRLYAAPPLHRGNVRQLCSSALSDRVYCVVLMDTEINTSSRSPDLAACDGAANFSSTAVDSEDEQASIQLVRVITKQQSLFHPEFALSVQGLEAFEKILQPAIAESYAFVLDLDAHRMAPLPGTREEVEVHLSALSHLINSSSLRFQPIPLRDIREALRVPECGRWLAARRWLKTASALQLVGVSLVFFLPWLSFHFMNLQRFMVMIVVAPIMLALCSDDFFWLVRQYWNSA